MKLIVGLGNPEKKYLNTRHNIGFLFLDRLREKFLFQGNIYPTEWRVEDTFNSELCFIKEGSRIIAILQKPLTYMNKSGEAVSKVVKKYEIVNIEENLILVHDDLDIKFGNFKIQVGKSPLGHNGIKSVEDRLGMTSFKRVRIGIENREDKNIPGEDYVLMNFSKEEKEVVEEILEDAVRAVLAEILL
ncbi:MAG: aminoacyl-tRNA hydrolase [Candidatus Dojkabacteria bacterium]